jgi:hypothetical protein
VKRVESPSSRIRHVLERKSAPRERVSTLINELAPRNSNRRARDVLLSLVQTYFLD